VWGGLESQCFSVKGACANCQFDPVAAKNHFTGVCCSVINNCYICLSVLISMANLGDLWLPFILVRALVGYICRTCFGRVGKS
jgi:hypothetical protein